MSCSKSWKMLSLLTLSGLVWSAPAGAFNQGELELVTVPFAPSNLDLPLPAHEYARITLKAILRGATCSSGYDVAWDTDRDGSFADEATRRVYPTSGTKTVYDLGRTYEVPPVDGGTTLTLNVRARSKCDADDEAYGTFRVYVYDWAPSNDARKWTKDQLEVMSNLAIQESLWYLHRRLKHLSGSGASIKGTYDHSYGSRYQAAANLGALWALSANGHQPAYPPGTINTFGQPLPEGWEAANERRWRDDPYAESMARMVNFATGLSAGVHWYSRPDMVAKGDEDNTCGWNEDGSEKRCDRIPGTNNGGGTWTGYDSGAYMSGLGLGALATLLPSLSGTPVQTGHSNNSVRSKPWDWYIQEMVDWLGYMQLDSGCPTGGWLYNVCEGCTSCSHMDASTAQWAYIGLESAEVAGKPYGVIVNNRHKYRTVENLIQNQSPHGASSYRTSYKNNSRHDFHLTGGAFVAARWVGIHNMARGDERPFLPYVNRTRTEMVDMYERYKEYTAQYWTASNLQGIHWTAGLFQNGDYLCGQPMGVYNAPTCGYTYAIYSHQKGYRTGTPELLDMGGHDWVREFNTYYVRAQSRHLNDYDQFGYIWDTWQRGHSVTRYYAKGELTLAWATLVLTPTLFRPKPVALGTAKPGQVIEGCSGGTNGRVLLDHSDSFHPNSQANITDYQWDVDAADGLWWETGAPADYETHNRDAMLQHTYQEAGGYTATLRVLDDDPTAPQFHVATVKVQVDAAPAKAPGALAGGPYAIEVGQALELGASASDANLACGDALTTSWDLDGDGQFDDGEGLTPTIPADRFEGWPLGAPHPIRVQVQDASGLSAVAESTMTIYPREPVASARVNPAVAECRQVVRFDGGASSHPNPARSIVKYEWDVHPDPGAEGTSQEPEFGYTYSAFGTYDGTLTVTDDRGRTHTASFQVDVSGGNRPPVARTSEAIYAVNDGADLALDGSLSSDPDGLCGDRIVEYAWDIDGNGRFDDPVDARGAQVVVPWATLQNMQWPADRDSGLPVNPIRLRVTDALGLSSTLQTGVRIYQTRPVAVIVQAPADAPLDARTGLARVSLDGRASHSPIPTGSIIRYDWDLNDDGEFEVQGQPIVQARPAFWPVPDVIPETFVRLRVTDADGRTGAVRQLLIMSPPGQARPTAIPHVDEALGGEYVGGPSVNGARGGYHIFAGQPVALDASESFDPEEGDYVALYRWDLDGDGAWDLEIEDADGDGEEARVTVEGDTLADAGWDTVGRFELRLQVVDRTGLSHDAVTEVHIYPVEPSVSVVASPNPAACNGQVTLDASDADHGHPDVDVVSWRWDLDDDGVFDDALGETVSARFDAFTFGAPNRVSVEVTDSANHTATASATVTVNQGNRAPSAEAGGPYAVAFGQGVSLDGSASSDPDASCGDTILRYRWDLDGDGAVDVEGAQPSLTAEALAEAGLDEAGQYTVHLSVVDRFGRGASDEARLWLVAPPTAVAQASRATAACNEPVAFSGARSTHDGPEGGDFEIVTYAWDMDGDGVFERDGSSVLVPVVAEDQVTATLRVVDGLGRADTATVTVGVDVANVRPVADAGGPYVTAEVDGDYVGVDLDARGTLEPNAPCDHIAVYAWDTDNDGLYGADDVNGAGSLVGADYTGALVRSYVNANWRVGTTQVVRVKALDAFGAWSAPAEAEIRVRAKMPPAGELLWPRGGDCVPAAAAPVSVSVRLPGGGEVTLSASASGVELGAVVVELPANGDATAVEIPIDSALVPEGLNGVTVSIIDDEGLTTTLSSGGQVVFDRTAPVIDFNAMLVEGACYRPGEVPGAELSVTDALDPAPAVVQSISEDVCVRTLDVQATDACGNVSEASRGWTLAEPVGAGLMGPADGAVVATAAFDWSIDAPAACVTHEAATISADGGAALPYIQGTVIAQPGQYRFNLSLANCEGEAYAQQRVVRVNAPPVPHVGGPYVVGEGRAVRLGAGASLPPELEDAISRYEWDLDRDGVYELVGESAAYTALDAGEISGILRVTDSFGASATAPVSVVVREVAPMVDAGGPYRELQGVPVEFDASGSRPGSPADLLTWWSWDFGDGNTASGAELSRPSHTYAADGLYNATLTIHDEDGSVTVPVPVTILDVLPDVSDIQSPVDPYEVRGWELSVEATPGSPSEPLQIFTWDFGDGSEPVSGPLLSDVTHQWREAGTYTVTVTVGDTDSQVVKTMEVEVREATLPELIEQVSERLDAVDQGPLVDTMVDSVAPWMEMARWGAEHGHMGNALLALEHVVGVLVTAQGVGAELDDTIWLLLRAVRRVVESERQRIVTPAEGEPLASANHPSVVKADQYYAASLAISEAEGFEERVSSPLQSIVANDAYMALFEAYFYLSDAAHPCKDPGYAGFEIPGVRDLVERAEAANDVNVALGHAIAGLALEFQEYVELGLDVPGREHVLEALQTLRGIQVKLGSPVGLECEDGECLSDRDALVVLLDLMDLATELSRATSRGVYVRNWQACLVEGVKFRTALSEMRLEYVCGPYSPITLKARVTRANGMRLIDEKNDVAAALDYFQERSTRCLAIWTYNKCLVPAFPEKNASYPEPEYCDGALDSGGDLNGGPTD